MVIRVRPEGTRDGYLLRSDAGDILVRTSHPDLSNIGGPADFAAWFFLPVAMRLGQNLLVEGAGHAAACDNFRRLSEIWRTWLPGHFDAVNCDFAEMIEAGPNEGENAKDLLLFSGGIDATFTGLRRQRSGLDQHLLTVHGMDYDLAKQDQFDALMEKTAAFARSLSDTWIVVRTDAYALYRRHGVNIKGHHLMHPFALAGAGFFHAKTYRRIILAADERLDGQFLTHPWGTNSATDRLFDDGRTAFVTDGDDFARIDKLHYLRTSQEALDSLSFCWNRRLQPRNCGVCSKCLRTKLLFLADDGIVPPVFLDDSVPDDWLRMIAFKGPAGLLAVCEILDGAARNGTRDAIPGYRKAHDAVFGYYTRRRARERLFRSLDPRRFARRLRKKFRKGAANR